MFIKQTKEKSILIEMGVFADCSFIIFHKKKKKPNMIFF